MAGETLRQEIYEDASVSSLAKGCLVRPARTTFSAITRFASAWDPRPQAAPHTASRRMFRRTAWIMSGKMPLGTTTDRIGWRHYVGAHPESVNRSYRCPTASRGRTVA